MGERDKWARGCEGCKSKGPAPQEALGPTQREGMVGVAEVRYLRTSWAGSRDRDILQNLSASAEQSWGNKCTPAPQQDHSPASLQDHSCFIWSTAPTVILHRPQLRPTSGPHMCRGTARPKLLWWFHSSVSHAEIAFCWLFQRILLITSFAVHWFNTCAKEHLQVRSYREEQRETASQKGLNSGIVSAILQEIHIILKKYSWQVFLNGW